MKFTQFIYPNGKQAAVTIDRPPEIEQLASDLIAAGYVFEIECKPQTQLVYMECLYEDDPLSNRLCGNGSKVPGMVDEMVREAHAEWINRGKLTGPQYALKLSEKEINAPRL